MYIRDWQRKMTDIYGKNNKALSIDYKMLHFSTKTGQIAKGFNHNHLDVNVQEKVNTYIAKSFAWLFAICEHFNLDLEDALQKGFPGVCRYCLTIPCSCSITKKKSFHPNTGQELSQDEYKNELFMKESAIRNSNARLSLTSFAERINKIYPSNKILTTYGYFSFPLGKLEEEKGELHAAYSKYLLTYSLEPQNKNEKLLHELKDDIIYEVSDVSAWLISLYGERHQPIDFLMSSLYINGCPSCNNAECTCPHYSLSTDADEIIIELRKTLNELREKMKNINTKQAKSIIKSIDKLNNSTNIRKQDGSIEEILNKASRFEGLTNILEKLSNILLNFKNIIT
ncbi:hypothetical protein [Cardiobacterium sp. Marseille-Q4385]|jgi:nucleotide pyrophosphohydrolase|uniref:hypothetical protein n=1 Tax=Cardiobacterium sp. Marseille-Q4385 TaxID=2866573 RepID=UPI001CE4B53D|nr:hypothetical protein [Cardiobacterium sp. Marseille-Q4385]